MVSHSYIAGVMCGRVVSRTALQETKKVKITTSSLTFLAQACKAWLLAKQLSSFQNQ
jgi:hypothetical protein